MNRHLLVGSGIAALAAAERIRAADAGAEITMVSAEAHAPYSRPGLAYLLTGDVPQRQLTIRSPAELRALALDRRVATVTQIDPRAHTAELAGGETLRWDRLLLATGSESLPPDFSGGNVRGVARLDGLDDTRAIIELASRARVAVVAGGGPTAVEIAEGLHARGLRVHHLLRGARYWASILEPPESAIVEAALEREGLRLRRHTRIARVVAAGGKVAAVETTGGERIACDLVAVAIGVTPRVALARSAGLAVNRGVIVDSGMRTSAADVFAAGDVAEHVDPSTGGADMHALWSVALASGRAAGASMAGLDEPRRSVAPLNVTRLGGVVVTIVGRVGAGQADDPDLLRISRGDSEHWRSAPRARAFHERAGERHVRVLVGESTVEGAVIVGDAIAARALVRLVRERVDISHLRAVLGAQPSQAVARLVSLGRGESGDWSADAPRA